MADAPESAKAFFEAIPTTLDPAKVKGMNAVYQWDLGDSGQWHVRFAEEGIEVGEGTSDAADITITCTEADWLDIVAGKLSGQTAFLMGKVKIQGDMSLAMKLQSLV
jgi:putative sterol carrier protein